MSETNELHIMKLDAETAIEYLHDSKDTRYMAKGLREYILALIAELAAKDARIAELEAVLREIADPKNSHKRNGSVYIPDVVQDIARAALSAERLMPDVKVNKTRKRYIKIPF
jgi:uncharacterized protein (DUF2164 family)